MTRIKRNIYLKIGSAMIKGKVVPLAALFAAVLIWMVALAVHHNGLETNGPVTKVPSFRTLSASILVRLISQAIG